MAYRPVFSKFIVASIVGNARALRSYRTQHMACPAVATTVVDPSHPMISCRQAAADRRLWLAQSSQFQRRQPWAFWRFVSFCHRLIRCFPGGHIQPCQLSIICSTEHPAPSMAPYRRIFQGPDAASNSSIATLDHLQSAKRQMVK
jgi:hypothetical protein